MATTRVTNRSALPNWSIKELSLETATAEFGSASMQERDRR
jgi:hypothetical protein